MSEGSSHDLPGWPPGLLSEDGAAAVENAVRAAVSLVMEAVRSACSRSLLEYQRVVADRDQEIRRLRAKLDRSESELETLRLEVCRRRAEHQTNTGTFG